MTSVQKVHSSTSALSTQHSALITHHSLLITHYSSLFTHHSSLLPVHLKLSALIEDLAVRTRQFVSKHYRAGRWFLLARNNLELLQGQTQDRRVPISINISCRSFIKKIDGTFRLGQSRLQ